MATDAVSLWLEAAGRQTIPSKQEQLTLGRLIQRDRQPDATRAEKRAAARAKDRLVSGNLRLIVPIARKFAKRLRGNGLAFEDLLQAGTLGLVRAVELYDPSRGYSLSTPAYWWISQAIRRVVLESDQAIRAPVHSTETIRRWRYRGEQTVEEFCAEHGLTREKLEMELLHHARANCTSLDQRLHEGGSEGSTLGELLADPASQPSTELLDFERAVQRLEALCPDDFALVELSAVGGHSGSELGQLMGVSRAAANVQIANAKRRLAVVAGAEARSLVA